MADNGNSTEPPVPPRRTKRKIKIAPIESSVASNGATKTTNDIAISQQKRPPPPLLLEKCRRNNSGYVETQPQCDTSATCPRADTEQHHRENRVTASKMIEVKRCDNTTSIRDNLTSSNSANDDPIPKSIISKSSSRNVASSKQKAFDKYPPLFFTLHDFENVVSDTWNRNVSPKNSQNLHEKESTKAHILDDNSDVCFRVTTTNLPFEKYLDKWKDSFDNDFARKFNECRFESSMNKNEVSDKRSFDYNNVFDNNDESKCRVGTKIRFMIESPSSSLSKRDSNVKISVPCDNSQSHESILNNEQASEQSAVSSVKLTEIREEFADVKDWCDNARDKSYTSSVDKRNSAKTGKDDPFIMEVNEVDVKLKAIPQMYCNDRNNDVNCEKIREEDFDLIPRNVQASEEIFQSEKENIITGKTTASDVKQMDRSNTSSGVVNVIDNSLEIANRIEKETKITYREEKMFLKKSSNDIKGKCVAKNEKLLFNESSQNEHDDNGESSKNISTDNLINKSDKIEQTRLLEENKKKSNFSENNHDTVLPSKDIFAKSVPVKVKRNSFLEIMLSDDSTDISMNYAAISVTSSMDKELSTTNKSPNQIRKLNADFTMENEHSRDFCNATKMDTKKQNIFNNSNEMEEKIVKILNVKSMQSENKSVRDVKNDVLNELLCNFNNIKLKIVSPENKKLATKIDEKISCRINSRISKEKENTSKSFEKSQNEICSVLLNTKITNINNDTPTVEKMIKEENIMKINIEEKPQNLKNDIPTIKKINIKTNIKKTSEPTKNTVENANRELKKLRDIHIPKTILKKTNIERERHKENESQKRIPIGAPTTMNKIFDSRELKAIADASRKNNLENDRKRERASREIHTRGKEKTDEDRRRITNRSALVLVEDTMSSGDKCAIAKKITSVNPYNNNDNNRAVTPVANVSNDQSFRDVVTITPGKVRSFVKYYEIRCDATTVEKHSKINDREKVARRKFMKSQAVPLAARNLQRPEVITKKKEMKDGGRSVKSNDCNLPGTSNKTQPSTFVPRNSFHNPIYKTIKIGSKMEEYEKNGSHIFDKETRAPFTKTAKKSVHFLGGYTVIHSENFGKDESARIIVDSDTNTNLKKRRAPGIPLLQDFNDQKLVREIAKSEKPLYVGEGTLRKAVTQIHAVTDHVQNSGINRFVLKPETPQLVFYCTI
ncbi:PREDICTED: origin recognition complex subunit 1-like [Atta cephalotes]|uniref:Uncharacterized protein n=1 Tax=Atta cephalotes TaxID=12957 RepID=A0A158NLM1_ATTCE|nr:PREDICTED: origin recognition complex subunit 1-like [Atta cephalotes]